MLRKVLVGFGDRVAFNDTLQLALDALFEGEARPTPTKRCRPRRRTRTTPPPPDVDPTVQAALADAQAALVEADAALRAGDFAAYGAAQARLRDASSAPSPPKRKPPEQRRPRQQPRRGRILAASIAAACRRPRESCMIFIAAKFRVRPEDADNWPEIAREFTQATRSEPGCLWFDWSRSSTTQMSTSSSRLSATRRQELPTSSQPIQAGPADTAALAETPRVINMTIPQDDCSELGELAVEQAEPRRHLAHFER